MSVDPVRRRDHAFSMNASEWIEIAAVLRDRWPHASLGEETITQWGLDLADLDAGQVDATIEALYRDGREFPPNPGLIRRKLTELALDTPEWGEVLRVLQRYAAAPAGAVIAAGHEEERDGHEVYVIDEERYPRRELLEAAPAMVRAFVEALGVDQIVEGADREAGGGAEARLREKWVAFARGIARDVAYAGIPDAGLPALRRANDGFHELGTGIGAARKALEAGR